MWVSALNVMSANGIYLRVAFIRGGPRGALRAAHYAGRATRAGVLRTAQVPYTGGQILLMKPSGRLLQDFFAATRNSSHRHVQTDKGRLSR